MNPPRAPVLATFANLWTLWDHPAPGAGEWAMDRKVSAVAGAGFRGVMGGLGEGLGALARREGLRYLAFARLDARHDFERVLDVCREEEALVLQVHLGWHDTGLEEAVELALRLDAASRRAGVEAVIETHRDTCTETPEKTRALCRQFEEATGGRALPLLLDLSHEAVVKHLDPPYAQRLLRDAELVMRTRWHHLRPFNGHHAQIPVTTAEGTVAPEMGDWLELVRAVFGLLRRSGLPEVWVCPEVGPLRGGYGLSAFPPSWAQAQALRLLLVEAWGSIRD